MLRFRSSKLFIIVLVVLVLASSTCAAPVTPAPDPLVKYAVSNIVYAFDTANPSNLTSVAFDLDNPAANVKVILTASGTMQNCTSPTPFTHWTCPLTGVTVTTIRLNMRVVVSQ